MAECASCGCWTQYGEVCIRCRKKGIVVAIEYESNRQQSRRPDFKIADA